MTQAVCQEAMDMLNGKSTVFVADNGDPNNYLDEMRDAEAVIVRIGKLDRNAIERSPNLKVIGRTGVGYDNVDVEAATAAGIPVVITPGTNNRSVAEHTLAMVFAVSKNLVEGHNETQRGNFSIRSAGKAFEILGKTIGFIGLGAIGIETARLCKALGMETAGYDPFLSKEAVEAMGCAYYSDYEQMLGDCDFISLHTPLTADTRNMITLKQLKMMKRTAGLINCARGGLIDEADLAVALNEGLIAAAGIDVFETEPPAVDNPLFSAKNVLCSPHSAAQTRESVIGMHTMCVKGCLDVLNGEKFPHVANREVYNHPNWN